MTDLTRVMSYEFFFFFFFYGYCIGFVIDDDFPWHFYGHLLDSEQALCLGDCSNLFMGTCDDDDSWIPFFFFLSFSFSPFHNSLTYCWIRRPPPGPGKRTTIVAQMIPPFFSLFLLTSTTGLSCVYGDVTSDGLWFFLRCFSYFSLILNKLVFSVVACVAAFRACACVVFLCE